MITLSVQPGARRGRLPVLSGEAHGWIARAITGLSGFLEEAGQQAAHDAAARRTGRWPPAGQVPGLDRLADVGRGRAGRCAAHRWGRRVCRRRAPPGDDDRRAHPGRRATPGGQHRAAVRILPVPDVVSRLPADRQGELSGRLSHLRRRLPAHARRHAAAGAARRARPGAAHHVPAARRTGLVPPGRPRCRCLQPGRREHAEHRSRQLLGFLLRHQRSNAAADRPGQGAGGRGGPWRAGQ